MLYSEVMQDVQRKLHQQIGRRDAVQKEIEETAESIKSLTREYKNVEEAQLIAQTVAQQTQQELEYSISSLVTLAIDAVFDDGYEFKLEFVSKRNKTEADIYFMRNGKRVNPMDSSGGGAVDIAAFAMRVALWKLSGKGRLINTIVLDEPFRFLSRELQPRAGAMLKMLSRELGMQFIIITHNDAITESADKVFEVKLKRGVSHVMS